MTVNHAGVILCDSSSWLWMSKLRWLQMTLDVGECPKLCWIREWIIPEWRMLVSGGHSTEWVKMPPKQWVGHAQSHTVTLCAKLSGTVYCYRSCLWQVGGWCLWVCVWVVCLEIACIDLRQTGSVGKSSDRLQLMKFWPSRAPGNGSAAGRTFLGPSYYSQRAVFASLWALFSF